MLKPAVCRFAFVLPVVALVSLYSTIRTGSLLGILFLSLLAVELFAPLSKVRPFMLHCL